MTGNLASHLSRTRATDLAMPADYLRQVAEQLADMGVDLSAWLAGQGLDAERLADPALALPIPQFRRLVADALRVSGEPALGLLVGQRLVVHTHGLLGVAAQHCRSLRELVDVFVAYIGLRTPMVSLRYEVRADEVRVICEERLVLGDTRRAVLEAIVLALKNVLDFLALGWRPVRAVAFPFEAPPYLALARDVLQCEPRYRCGWTGLVLARELFDKPLKPAQVEDFRRAALACAEALDQLAQRSALRSRVRALLLENGTGGFPSLQATARLLNHTPRTLHRHLVAEGSSYRELLDEVRHTLAVQHLQAGELSVEAIAYALGYSDVANFRRAFRRCAGVPPGQQRAACGNGVSRLR